MPVCLAAFFVVPLIGSNKARVYRCIGRLWVTLTLAFEFLLGHHVTGRPGCEVLRVFDVARGDLLLLVLAVAGISTRLAARVRGRL